MVPIVFASPGLALTGKFKATTLPCSMSSQKRRQRYAITAILIRDGVVACLRRTKGALHRGVVIEQRKEYGDAFYDAGAQFRFNSFPVIVEPTLDGLESRRRSSYSGSSSASRDPDSESTS